MRELAIALAPVSEKKAQAVSKVEKKRPRWILALILSSTSGVLAGLTGLIISGLSLVEIVEKTGKLDQIGIWLIVAAFPLVIFSAHALDKIREIEKE